MHFLIELTQSGVSYLLNILVVPSGGNRILYPFTYCFEYRWDIVEISCYFVNTYSGKINTANIAGVNVLVRAFQIQRMYVERRMDNDGKKILF